MSMLRTVDNGDRRFAYRNAHYPRRILVSEAYNVGDRWSSAVWSALYVRWSHAADRATRPLLALAYHYENCTRKV